MQPYLESDPNHYCRLFKPLDPPRSAEKSSLVISSLAELGRSMTDDLSPVSDKPEILLDSGYTYFGQFLDHDVTKDTSSLQEAWRKDPKDLENLQSPRLDLQQLYGNGPRDPSSAHLYQNDKVRLKVGKPGSSGYSFDVAEQDGQPLLADARSTENLIIRQITAFFARLHNLAVDQFKKEINNIDKLFERARLQTTWQYQYLVVEDYLLSVLDPVVYNKIFVEKKTLIEWQTFSIPVEFSVAAMRFGHSMVRSTYLFSLSHDFSLEDIFHRANQPGPLEDEWRIEWGFFFQGASGLGTGTTTSRPIDTRLTDPLHHLPEHRARLFNAASFGPGGDPPQLSVRSLLRGAGLKLASGQAIAAAFGEKVLSADKLMKNGYGKVDEAGKVLRDHDLLSQTPFYFYLLRESEVRENGNRLGPVGSRILGEIFSAALRGDPESYLCHPEAKEEPPIWKIGGEKVSIHWLSELFRLARQLPAN